MLFIKKTRYQSIQYNQYTSLSKASSSQRHLSLGGVVKFINYSDDNSSNKKKMTSYGTIQTAPPGSSLDFISGAKDRAKSALATSRPWKEMIHRHALSIPHGLAEAFLRFRTNLAYFRMNYSIIVLLIVFLSLLWHPISLIVFVIMMAAWLLLYFLRDEPLAIFHRTIDDRIVLALLAVITLVALFLTHATLNILVSILIGLAIVVLHAVFRKTEDLFVDEEAGGGGLYSVVEGNEPPSSSSS